MNSLHTDNQNKIASAGITEVSLNSPNEDINSSAVQLEASENIEIDQQNLLYASTEASLNNSNEDINSSAGKLEVSENIEIDQQNFLLRYANGERDFHGLKLTGVNNGLKLDGANGVTTPSKHG
ncbi:hypothetical protein Q5692_17715 [Microcoleus sp. C2C3]|uniref:hypothetical protein n=1 Tax=unclassified Microcoleus TaxID=2642155 RepID=UPI002FD5D247